MKAERTGRQAQLAGVEPSAETWFTCLSSPSSVAELQDPVATAMLVTLVVPPLKRIQTEHPCERTHIA